MKNYPACKKQSGVALCTHSYDINTGAQWLSGRVLDLRSRGLQRHCAVSFSNTLYPLFSNGSTQEESGHDLKNVDWDVKHQHTQTYNINNEAYCNSHRT